MSAENDRPAVPTENEADALEQQTPADPETEAQEDTGIQDPVHAHGDPLRPDGSEADRLEQNADGGVPPEEDEYPRDAGENRPG